jgi:CRP-like cAMP-binding protein
MPSQCAILREGQDASGFFLIVEGEVDVLVTGADGTERHLSRLGSGEFFGETALMMGTPVTATIRTRTPVELLRLSPEDFHAIIGANLADSLAQLQSRRARERERVQQAAPMGEPTNA